MNDRLKQIREMIPPDVRTVLDIGCSDKSYLEGYDVTTIDCKLGANIIMDLNHDQEIFLPDKLFDLVILSQILEHLPECKTIIAEAQRLSRKYVLVGLPNEMTIDRRISFLFGRFDQAGYNPKGHKHFYNVVTIPEFLHKFIYMRLLRKYYIFGIKGGRFIPLAARKFMASMAPSLFAKEAYFLFRHK